MAKSEDALATEPQSKTTAAAYVSFRTFLSAIEALEHGVPKQIDRTIWRSQSGIVQSQIMMAFRFFDLVNDEDRPTPALHRLVEAKDRRQEHIRALLHHSYHSLIEHDLTKMTPRMLDDEMDQYNVSGDTKRKAVSFFLQAARYAELPMHPLLAGQIRTPGPRRKRARRESGGSTTEPAMPAEPVLQQMGSVKTVNLKSGGTLVLSISVDVFSMSADDRQFVFGLIDKLQEYEGKPA